MTPIYFSTIMRIDYENGAITQPLRMMHHQTQINAVESWGKFMLPSIESSSAEVNNPDKAINDRCSLKRDIPYIYTGEVL